MRPPNPRNWYAEDLSKTITDEPTPEAQAVMLIQAVTWPEDVAVTPYCGGALIVDAMAHADLEGRYLGILVAPGAVHGQFALGRSFDLTTDATTLPSQKYHEAWTSDGGSSGNDVVRVPWALNGAKAPKFVAGTQDLVVSAPDEDDTPAAPTNRAFELQTLGYPYVEPAYVSRCGSASFVVSERIDDLESL